MKKTINEYDTLDQFLEAQILTEKGFNLYKSKLSYIESEGCVKKEISNGVKFFIIQYANFMFPE